MVIMKVVIFTVFSVLFLTSPALAQGREFHGYPCTQDCSGHRAGYEWAQRRGITSPYECGGNSRSFIEGCHAWADEQTAAGRDDGEDSADDADAE